MQLALKLAVKCTKLIELIEHVIINSVVMAAHFIFVIYIKGLCMCL